MKEQIEEILREYWNDEANDFMPTTGGALKKARKAIMKLIPNNDWLEYPKHKPSAEGKYVVQYPTIEVGLCHSLNFDDLDVRYFKPIPVEPFVKKNKYVEVLDFITSSHFIDMEAQNYNALIELKAKIENGDLK